MQTHGEKKASRLFRLVVKPYKDKKTKLKKEQIVKNSTGKTLGKPGNTKNLETESGRARDTER